MNPLPEKSIILDIETVADFEEAKRLRTVPENLLIEVSEDTWDKERLRITDELTEKANSYKQDKTIQKHLAEVPAKVSDHMSKWYESFDPDKWMSDAALDPTRSRLAGYGFLRPWPDKECVASLINPGDEFHQVNFLVNYLVNYDCIIGHCVKDFDLAWIIQRARILGVDGHASLAERVFYKKPWEGGILVLDTYEAGRLSRYAGLQTKCNPNDSTKPGGGFSCSLDSLCKIYGLPGKTRPDGGENFGRLTDEEKLDYLKGDIEATEGLARLLFAHYQWPEPLKKDDTNSSTQEGERSVPNEAECLPR